LLSLTNAFAPVGIASTAHAATYYVDATNGNDPNDGLSTESAWKTIHKVNGTNFNPGDSILFKRGETWREQLNVRSSGEEGNPITFGAYGEVITGWSLYDEEKNIYVADVASEITQLFVDGKRQTLARWPNSGWQNIDADSADNTSLYSESLTQPSDYWAGATIVIKTISWKIETKTVIANSQNEHSIAWNGDTNYIPKEGHGFYLEGKFEEIDTSGEWFYSGGQVYLCIAEGEHPDNHLIAFAKPEINGADVVAGWSIYEHNKDGSVIYVADVGSEVTQLFVDGQRQTLARWPNSGWQNIDADSADKTSLYSECLTQPSDYWAGATIVIKTRPWKIETKIVTANSGYTITWNDDTRFAPKKDYGFYLEGKLEEIDTSGEWCCNGGAIYLCMAEGEHPDNHLIESSVRDYGIKIHWKKEYINIKNISIKYTSSHGIYISYCSHININNNTISFSKGRGIYIKSYPPETHDHIYITSNSISQTKADGIYVRNIDYGEITDNDLTDIASDEVSPKKATAILAEGNTNFTVSGNRVDKVSYIGIRADSAGNNTISYNNISNCLLLLYDGGGIYSWGENSEDLIIKYNIVRDIIGNAEGTPASEPSDVIGIYLDDFCSGVTVEGNIVFNCGTTGMLLHNVHNNTIVNNVFYNNHKRSVHLSEGCQQDYMHDNDFYNNILFATGTEELTWLEASAFSSSGTMGTYNNNLHYNPNFEATIKYRRGSTQYYTLEQWQTFSGQDEYSIAADPLFVDASNHDFHLQPFSFCINKGIDVGLTEDFEGNSVDSAPDIGAYEYEVTDYNGCPMPPTSLTVIRISN
jgi:parallel beta-helix repeat protein